ncbi:MAG: SLATT domain-containing protein [Sulfuritalea sp.]|nr:SLATT domain-containing protein [Sulfuritalea sp.]
MTQPSPASESLVELHRRADLTSKARYHAARRLRAHNSFSQWTLALLAVGQIVITLVAALKLRTSFAPAYVDFGGVFFGVLVLAYSLLLGMADYSARSVKMHECGIELGALARELFFLSRDPSATRDDYNSAAERYYSILSKHENHSGVDYIVSDCESRRGQHFQDAIFSMEWFQWHIWRGFTKAKIYSLHALQFSHYVISVALIWGWIYFLVTPAHG